MDNEHATVHEVSPVQEVCYSTPKFEILVEKWWLYPHWRVNVIIRDIHPATEICLETENVEQLIAALTTAREKAEAMKAELRANGIYNEA